MAVYDLIELQNDMTEYSDYDMVGSVARAKLYVTAARRWIGMSAGSSSNESSSMSLNIPQVEKMIERAQAYIAANDTSSANGSRVKFLSVGNFR